MNIGVGVHVFNPTDDTYHNERIQTCLNSLQNALKTGSVSGGMVICLNTFKGLGKACRGIINDFRDKYPDTDIIEQNQVLSPVLGYYKLQQQLINKNHNYIVVYADDYIVPSCHFIKIKRLFSNKNPDYIMPVSCFLPQAKLNKQITIKDSWIKSKYGIHGGVTIEEVNIIAKRYINNLPKPISPNEWNSTNSFETTIFKSVILKDVGFTDPNFNYLFHNWDLFRRINTKYHGIIADNCFIFHYGKGGTKSYYKETEDEKYNNSPVDVLLEQDIQYWNKKWGDNVKRWW
jgi:hypothetical protein